MQDIRKKGKKRLAWLMAAVMLLGLFTVQTYAVVLDPKEEPCSIIISMPEGEAYADLANADLVADVYQIAEADPVDPEGTYDMYKFTYDPALSDEKYHVEPIADVIKEGGEIKAEDIDALTQNLAQAALVDELIKPVGEPVKYDAETKKINVTGIAAGLYLIIPYGSDIEEYFTNEGGVISMTADTEDNVFTFAPMLVSVPNREIRELGTGNVAGNEEWTYPIYIGNEENTGEWDYDIELNAKIGYTPIDKYGSLEITKTLTDFAYTEGRSDEATFVFQVEVTDKDGNKVLSNVYTTAFTAAGTQTVVKIDELPVGATAVVTEVYSGNYKAEQELFDELVIVADADTSTAEVMDPLKVEFRNSWNNTNYGTGSVTNRFVGGASDWDPARSTKTYADGTSSPLMQ